MAEQWCPHMQHGDI